MNCIRSNSVGQYGGGKRRLKNNRNIIVPERGGGVACTRDSRNATPSLSLFYSRVSPVSFRLSLHATGKLNAPRSDKRNVAWE